MLCAGCLSKFTKDPASLKTAPPSERKQSENKPMKGSGGKSAVSPTGLSEARDKKGLDFVPVLC
jgi:hypothetical protein